MNKIRLISIVAITLLLAMPAALAGCSGGDDGTAPSQAAPAAESKAPDTSEAVHIQIEVRDLGIIEADLYPNVAPDTVANFVKLAKDGFYDGLTFHRVIDGFMIQGGDPLGNGQGGSDTAIRGEFSNNGFENGLSHVRGALSMARSRDYDSASSQFFIVQADSPFLDGDYAAFGMVTSGMDIVDDIVKETPMEDQNGTVLPENQPVIASIKVIE